MKSCLFKYIDSEGNYCEVELATDGDIISLFEDLVDHDLDFQVTYISTINNKETSV